ncbi:hypothetical protein [Kitasatospora sp. NPDC050463]|uniref:hypothetical protein n=1 Tax=Kitasatospora sp. NPDC050463 TaxID=3155786 RepID=UPI0033FCB7AC
MVLVAPPMKLRALRGGFKQFLGPAGQLTVTGGIDHETVPEMNGFDSIFKIKWSISVLALTSVHL